MSYQPPGPPSGPYNYPPPGPPHVHVRVGIGVVAILLWVLLIAAGSST
jgi:hypothetical protein